MANISMKFILLLATMAVVCSMSMCSGFRQCPSGLERPTPSPYVPNPRPLFSERSRFRREAAIEPKQVNAAAELDELVRQAREAPEETVYDVEPPKHYYTN